MSVPAWVTPLPTVQAATDATLLHSFEREGADLPYVREKLRRNRCDCGVYDWTHQRGVGRCREVRR